MNGPLLPRGIAAVNALKSHCDHGHEFTPQNTRVRTDGGRSCRACERERSRRRKAARRLDP